MEKRVPRIKVLQNLDEMEDWGVNRQDVFERVSFESFRETHVPEGIRNNYHLIQVFGKVIFVPKKPCKKA